MVLETSKRVKIIKNSCFKQELLIGLSAGRGINDGQKDFDISPHYSNLLKL